ncbi:hypothetical protein Q7M76_00295 [Candidatus Liberibacter asiaticus]|uniref:Uncharacterized protein n=3 Tax=Liberibacter asiaticus TaxID=34021 RepID=C6XHB9_LIBAP|nr:hypothetical protein [Candidatus Liberibacter asiaticus]ACT56662.1 hypothetical protein CLIBASIA_00370 [Candidatus Liberibacter asiaticus str. psy62]AGH16431.1 hypothetical protein WSI_00280 [Candidatus Liberibacter asiaticus str. gxpsy]MBE2996099.1 hypothetical protein [Candidatus Liberibacter asiaticus]MCU7488259.1 hypothetical protein [Candidatus Liberibacter asiaticus]MCU7489289.1 hypothetical protein [Candidatus Liberibacter asiaticus]
MKSSDQSIEGKKIGHSMSMQRHSKYDKLCKAERRATTNQGRNTISKTEIQESKQ